MEVKSRFKFFRQSDLAYLDSAATTQVPAQVVRAVAQSLEYKGNPGRGSHPLAMRGERLLLKARKNIADFIGAEAAEIAFVGNTTDAFNMAVQSIIDHVRGGDEILISIAEHHSHLLPYTKLTKKGAILKFIGIKSGMVDPADVKKALSPRTRIVAIGHCSNVLGNINDVSGIGEIIKTYRSDILYFVDGAQAIAHIPVDVKKIRADIYAFSSHKMYGPDGVGVLYVTKDTHPLLAPVRVGGGTVTNVAVTFGREDSISPDYHSSLVTLEGGTPNVSSIVGLSEAVNFLRTLGFERIRAHEHALLALLMQGLASMDDVIVHGPSDLSQKSALISFSLRSLGTKDLADYLTRRGVCVRFGSHCAFPLTEILGQETIRVSLAVYTDKNDIHRVLAEIQRYLDKKKGNTVNPNLERLRAVPHSRDVRVVHSHKAITDSLRETLRGHDNSEIIVMGGHFLGIPDIQQNRFWAGIKPSIPERLHSVLEEFGMTDFPLYTWELACKTVADLKKQGYVAKLSIIANDTTGINEIRLTDANTSEKTAEQYRDELLASFKEDGDLPLRYVEILKRYNLSKHDVLKCGDEYFFRETTLRANFKKFISRNKEFFDGVITYSAGSEKNIDLSINVLNNQEIKTCTFDTFRSKAGGKFCIVELCQYFAELFGKTDSVSFQYVSEKVKNPRIMAKNKVFLSLTPAMCNSAVVSAGELYVKLFRQRQRHDSFTFLNVPLGPDPNRTLKNGSELTRVSDAVL